MRIDDSPIPKRMSLISRKVVSIPQRVPSYRISVRVLTVRSLDTLTPRLFHLPVLHAHHRAHLQFMRIGHLRIP